MPRASAVRDPSNGLRTATVSKAAKKSKEKKANDIVVVTTLTNHRNLARMVWSSNGFQCGASQLWGVEEERAYLKRRGHTKAALDLTKLAGLPPARVLCEVVDDKDGSMACFLCLKKFAKQHGFPLISIDALVTYCHCLDSSCVN